MDIQKRLQAAMERERADRNSVLQRLMEVRMSERQNAKVRHARELRMLDSSKQVVEHTLGALANVGEFNMLFGDAHATEVAGVDNLMLSDIAGHLEEPGPILVTSEVGASGKPFAYAVHLSLGFFQVAKADDEGYRGPTDYKSVEGVQCVLTFLRVNSAPKRNQSNLEVMEDKIAFLDASTPRKLEDCLLQEMAKFMVEHAPEAPVVTDGLMR